MVHIHVCCRIWTANCPGHIFGHVASSYTHIPSIIEDCMNQVSLVHMFLVAMTWKRYSISSSGVLMVQNENLINAFTFYEDYSSKCFCLTRSRWSYWYIVFLLANISEFWNLLEYIDILHGTCKLICPANTWSTFVKYQSTNIKHITTITRSHDANT